MYRQSAQRHDEEKRVWFLLAILSRYNKMISKSERQQLREKQGNRCYYCGEILHSGGDNPVTIDHVIPRAVLRGSGVTVQDNYVCACYRCNQKKGSKLPVGWKMPDVKRRAGDWILTDFGNWIYQPELQEVKAIPVR